MKGAIALIRSQWLKQIETWLFHVCDVISTSIATHMMLTTSSMVHFINYVKTIERRCYMTLLVRWCCWQQYKHHMTPMPLSMATFYLSGKDHWNKVQHDSDGIINTTTAFLSTRWLKWNANDSFNHLTLFSLASASCDADGIVNSTIALGQDDWINVQHNFFVM